MTLVVRLVSDIDKFSRNFLENSPETNSVEHNWSDFKDSLLKLLEKHVPSRLVKPHRDLPWMNREIRQLTHKKQRWFNLMQKTRSRQVRTKFRHVQKAVQKCIRKAYWDYVNTVLTPKMEENSKHFWKFIKGRRQDSTGIAALRSNGQLESDPKIKAEILNNFFKSVFTKEDEENMPILPPSKYPDMPDLNITETGVIKLLSDLNPNKASGPDEIPGRLLKLAAAQIAPSLTFIFNQSLRTGDLPEDWRKANVSPIYKKENRTNPGNYRPVSLTCICCKLFEHIIHSQIMDFFDKHGILSDRQHGFHSERSCETQLLITIDDLARSIDQRKQTDIIILDFSKAFHTVPHTRLISKLSHYGIRGNTLRWISNFLCERHQRVVIDGHEST